MILYYWYIIDRVGCLYASSEYADIYFEDVPALVSFEISEYDGQKLFVSFDTNQGLINKKIRMLSSFTDWTDSVIGSMEIINVNETLANNKIVIMYSLTVFKCK